MLTIIIKAASHDGVVPADRYALRDLCGLDHAPDLMAILSTEIFSEIKETPERIPYQEIIDHLNVATGRTGSKRFRVGSGVRRLVRGRWRDGYRLDDFIQVIDVKVKDWLDDPKWSKYLRPSTLFNVEKFDDYIGQVNQESIPVETESIEDRINREMGWTDE